MDSAVPTKYRVELKEIQKKDEYLDLARDLKKLWDIKVTVIPIISGALGIVIKESVQGVENLKRRGRGETIQAATLLRLARIRRKVQKTCRDSRRLHRKTRTRTDYSHQKLTTR